VDKVHELEGQCLNKMADNTSGKHGKLDSTAVHPWTVD